MGTFAKYNEMMIGNENLCKIINKTYPLYVKAAFDGITFEVDFLRTRERFIVDYRCENVFYKQKGVKTPLAFINISTTKRMCFKSSEPKYLIEFVILRKILSGLCKTKFINLFDIIIDMDITTITFL